MWDVRYLFGGIEWLDDGYLDLLALGRWLFLYGMLLFFFTLFVNRKRRSSQFILYRYRTFRKWWSVSFWSGIFITEGMFFGIVFICFACNGVGDVRQNLYICIVYGIHLALAGSIIRVVDFLYPGIPITAYLIIWEGVSYVLSVQFDCSGIVSGMYVRSTSYISGGFSIETACIIKGILIGLCYETVCELWKKGYIDGKDTRSN